MKVLLYGATGWIGGQMIDILRKIEDVELVKSTCRLNEYAEIASELDRIKPTHVLLAAGLTGRPNVDWCEDHKNEVLRVNVIGTSVLVDECYQRNIHLTYFGTGCIYEYDLSHNYLELSNSEYIAGCGYKENDEPNFDKSFYSKTKIFTEKILKNYDNVLVLRIRMPLSDDLSPRNFITKITKYQKVVNVPNSMTILHEMLPIAADMLINNKVGIYNFTNPGIISHNQILTLYQKYIDPDFTWTNFSLNEQSKILKAGRSNNHLNVDKLKSEYPNLEDIQVGIVKLFERMQHNLNS